MTFFLLMYTVHESARQMHTPKAASDLHKLHNFGATIMFPEIRCSVGRKERRGHL